MEVRGIRRNGGRNAHCGSGASYSSQWGVAWGTGDAFLGRIAAIIWGGSESAMGGANDYHSEIAWARRAIVIGLLKN